MERKLTKPADYERFKGRKIKLALREPIDKQKRWEGTLRGLPVGLSFSKWPTPMPSLFESPSENVTSRRNLKFEW